MTTKELRKRYIEFFSTKGGSASGGKEKGHAEIPSASLVPENDPTVLFTTAGMHPLVPYLLGEKHPSGKRLVNVQKCFRTTDIDEVGDDWHLTFFEMLGNWSLGDPDAPDGVGAGYWKREIIEWTFEFLTDKKWLGFSAEKLAVSVFEGYPPSPTRLRHNFGEVKGSGEAGGEIPADKEAEDAWLALGIPKERIIRLNREENWWGPAGETGPCGPDTEIFYWSGNESTPKKFDPNNNPPAGGWVEIWNNVFMQYNKTKDGRYEPLKQKNVDTGVGLERLVAVLNGCKSVYEIDEMKEIINVLCENCGVPEEQKEEFISSNEKDIRIIADHLRASIFIAAAGVLPSNKEAGYVLRRLIRRFVVAYSINLNQSGSRFDFIDKAREVVKKNYGDIYPEVKDLKITDIIINEIQKFQKTLAVGMKKFEKLKEVDGKMAFDLYQSYGFPIELTEELANSKGLEVDRKTFHEEFEKHKEISRAGSEKKFKGGLADDSEKTAKLHTATHLLQAALRKIIGEHIEQRGSNITEERLRFDFSHSQKLTEEEKKKVEDLVNEKIEEDLSIVCKEMSSKEAKKTGAIGLFGEKYGEKVKVYFIGDPEIPVTPVMNTGQVNAGQVSSGQVFSKEICGGPHVSRTGELGHFKIKKEEAVSAGIRRIKATLES